MRKGAEEGYRVVRSCAGKGLYFGIWHASYPLTFGLQDGRVREEILGVNAEKKQHTNNTL